MARRDGDSYNDLTTRDAYSESSFWKKAGGFARQGGYALMEKALWLYYAAQKPSVPAKAVVSLPVPIMASANGKLAKSRSWIIVVMLDIALPRLCFAIESRGYQLKRS